MTDYGPKERKIVAYLLDRILRGDRYFRASEVGNKVGLSPKEVGSRLPRLDEKSDHVNIEPWGRHNSTTWRVDPVD